MALVVPSPEEVGQLLACVPHLLHRSVLTVCYAVGLRISEAVSLRPAHIDSQRMLIRIAHGKGGKDRYVMLSPHLLEQLRDYWRRTRPPGEWLFPGSDSSVVSNFISSDLYQISPSRNGWEIGRI